MPEDLPRTGGKFNRRDFLKILSAAIGGLTLDAPAVTTILDAAPSVAVAAGTANVAAPLSIIAEELFAISMKAGFLHTGAYNGAQKTLTKVDELMASYHRFWNSALSIGHDKLSANQMAEFLVNEMHRKYGPLTDDPEQRQHEIRFHTQLLQQSIDYLKMDETALLDDFMGRAADGYAHWCKIYPRHAATDVPNKKPDALSVHAQRSASVMAKNKILGRDGEAENIESIFARADVRLLQTQTGLHIASLDKHVIEELAERIKPFSEHLRHAKHSITIEPVPHSIRSLARPYIVEYRHENAEENIHGIP